MARHVSFKSTRFDNVTMKPHFINPTTGFGEDVIAWLIENVRHPSITLDAAIQEDYGWGVWANVNGAPYWMAVSIDEETIGGETAEWQMTITYERGCNPFRRVPPSRPEDLMLLCRVVDTVLHSKPTVNDIQWWQQDFEAGTPMPHPE